MGKQFNHEGINNKMMGTETVEPVAQHDISGGQCGAANDNIILPKEGETSIDEKFKQLTDKNKKFVIRQIEILIASQSNYQ